MTRSLTFTVPPFGLEPHTGFVLDPIEGAVGLFRLTSADDPSLRLFVLDAPTHLPDYTPELPDAQRGDIGLDDSEAPDVFVVVTPAAGASTVNLLAPIVVNARTGGCQQVILANSPFSHRTPLGAGA